MDLCLSFWLTCRIDGVTPIIKCMVITALSVKHHTKIRIFSFSGQKYAFLKRAKKKKRVYATLRFSRVNFNRCHSRDHTGNENTGTDTVVYVCKLLEDGEGQQRSATLAKSKFK